RHGVPICGWRLRPHAKTCGRVGGAQSKCLYHTGNCPCGCGQERSARSPLRAARARRAARSRRSGRPHVPNAALCAAVPCALDLLAVLAVTMHGAQGIPSSRLRRVAAHGVPELFRTREEFDAYVAALVRAGVIEDSSYIWWAIRPSLLNPTLELRAPD